MFTNLYIVLVLRMNCNQLKKILKRNPNIIDLRDEEDFYISHIPCSHNINHVELICNPDKYLQKSKTYFLICYNGIRSKNVVKLLGDRKYRLINITDGFENWDGPTV